MYRILIISIFFILGLILFQSIETKEEKLMNALFD